MMLGDPILTTSAMRAAEDRAIAGGTSAQELMERAGAGVAEAVRRFGFGESTVVLCGPGNNGGDGYVAARLLRAAGVPVRVAALSDPKTDAAIEARRRWNGPVEAFPSAIPEDEAYSKVIIDAVFGTGSSRPIDQDIAHAIDAIVGYARLALAVDLPSGIDPDTGAELNRFTTPEYQITLALGAYKPAHVLQPAARLCGKLQLIDIGLGLDDIPSPRDNVSPDWTVSRPTLAKPEPWTNKYWRGMVIVVGGAMPGAGALAVEAAMRAGAGYGLLLSDATVATPHAIVRRGWSPAAISEAIKGKTKIRASVVIGPGLGRGTDAIVKLDVAIACGLPLVVDGDALHLLNDDHFEEFHERAKIADRDARVILTPHDGEFDAVFGKWSGSKIEAARAAARRSGAIIVFKGPDTVIAYPNGHCNIALPAINWLSTAGTGDVLAGVIGAMFFQSVLNGPAEAAVWMHVEAARQIGGAFIADDLVHMLTRVRASL
jgi:ADP-dependent NAD(P)H-hydrate dehydratase / NAD(P)H-hydrate epimerase